MLDNIQIMGKITVKDLRKITGLSQKEFSQKVGIPFTSYRRYESNVSKMEVGQLFHICDVLGVPIENIKF